MGALRRVRALHAIGWSARDVARLIGVREANLTCWAHRDRITRRLYERTCVAYDALSMTPGTSTRARRRAQRNGWPPPLQWPDELIDNPAAKPVRLRLLPRDAAPDPVAVERALAGEQLPLWPADRLEVARRIVARGGGPSEVSRVLRCNGTSARRLVEQVAV